MVSARKSPEMRVTAEKGRRTRMRCWDLRPLVSMRSVRKELEFVGEERKKGEGTHNVNDKVVTVSRA